MILRTMPYRSRRSNSSRLHRTMLDIYAKRRLFSTPLRLTLFVFASCFLCFSVVVSSPVRSTAAFALHSVSSALRGVAEIVAQPENSEQQSVSAHVTQNDTTETPRPQPVQVREVKEERKQDVFASLDYVKERRLAENHVAKKKALSVPEECALWRRIANDPQKVYPYRKHFTSLDVIDWFMYVAVFDELFHQKVQREYRPTYIDIAANHAKKWSATWFFDRCMGWDGVCVEANPKYYHELHTERHCHVVENCVSDTRRKVRFSMTNAYGGVVREGREKYGVDGVKHEKDEKFKTEFRGIKELTCTTVRDIGQKTGMNRFDFMSLDVEGHELPVLKGIDWNTTRIDVIVTEGRSREIKQLLQNKGYDLYKDVLKDWIYIHRDSGLKLSESALALVKQLDRATYKFTKP